jgi:2-polyprenyl-6-methoxyphenol hydroxylase-like FAD-dependent oxidoreductase
MSMSSLREPPLDALVVGAGPVGLILASELRRHGASCRIVDRAAAPTDKSKAVILHARTIEHLDQFALAQEFIERGTALHGVSFFQAAAASRSSGSIGSTRTTHSCWISRRAPPSGCSAIT